MARQFLCFALLFSSFALANPSSHWDQSLNTLSEALKAEKNSSQQVNLAKESAEHLGLFLSETINYILDSSQDHRAVRDEEEYLKEVFKGYASLAKELPESVQAMQMNILKKHISAIKVPDPYKDYKSSILYGSNWVDTSLVYKQAVTGIALGLYFFSLVGSTDPTVSTSVLLGVIFAPEIVVATIKAAETVRDFRKPKLSNEMAVRIDHVQEIIKRLSQNNWTSCESALNPRPIFAGWRMLI